MSNEAPTDALRLVPECQCNRCAQEAVDADGGGPFDPRLVRMFCCVQCGNKRCPHATDHRLACTGSNEAGQEGSSYGPPLKSAAPASPLPVGGWKPARHDVARRCDPKAWEFYDRHIDNPIMGAECRAEVAASIRMADAILALPAAPTGDA